MAYFLLLYLNVSQKLIKINREGRFIMGEIPIYYKTNENSRKGKNVKREGGEVTYDQR